MTGATILFLSARYISLFSRIPLLASLHPFQTYKACDILILVLSRRVLYTHD